MSQNAGIDGHDQSKQCKERRRWSWRALKTRRIRIVGWLAIGASIWYWTMASGGRVSTGTTAKLTEAEQLKLEQQKSVRGASSSRSVPVEDRTDRVNRLVLIKSFKTGSTTLATYITQIGHQQGVYFLHPEKTGWFAEGELQARLDAGQKYDFSVRHITPYTPYDVLGSLMPNAIFVTIMRRPLDRFLSLFNFRHNIRTKYKTPQALIAAILAGKLSQGDARPFCNQLAWLLSGKDVDFTNVQDSEEAQRVADSVIAEAHRWGVTVLLTERMSNSMAVLADLMGWNMTELHLRLGSQRVQQRSRQLLNKSITSAAHRLLSKQSAQRQNPSTNTNYYTCQRGDVRACEDAISTRLILGGHTDRMMGRCARYGLDLYGRGCNMVDELLYVHYEQQFDGLLKNIPNLNQTVATFESKPHATTKMSQLEAGQFPVTCRPRRQGEHSPRGAKEETDDEVFDRLHSCTGRPP